MSKENTFEKMSEKKHDKYEHMEIKKPHFVDHGKHYKDHVSPVPEPSTYVMMIVGLVLMAAISKVRNFK